MLRSCFKTLAKIGFPVKSFLERMAEAEASVSSKWAYCAHKRLLHAQWGIPPNPEHFDHNIDLYYCWQDTRNSLWVERGVFSSLALKGGNVLEIACGDGFNAKHFYSLRSKKVIAFDFDQKAISTAKRKNAAPNIEFLVADARTEMPQGLFENIVWDAAIEHFTVEEIQCLLAAIKLRLAGDGVLSGYTIVEKSDGTKSLHQHEYEFKSKNDLVAFLKRHFANVTVFETIYPSRHNLYFWASDGIVPFNNTWPHFAVAQ
jgi:SAM-dependent methyltransferase